uniref:Cytochrome P450 94A1 n=1 Tax=Fritillaria cirrhosa TaxID=108544 RepID=A0A1L7H7V5_9LILI|nr:cytochrome P450 94A1 [Fritillaria cirrhosa]
MDLWAVSSLLIPTIVFSAIINYCLFSKRRHAPQKTTAAFSGTTVVKPYPIIGNLPYFVKNRDRILDWIVELLTGSTTGTVTVAPFIFTADPAAVEHISRSHFTSYQKGHTVTTSLHDFLGDGIFNNNGENWRLQRKTASFEFNTSSLRNFIHSAVSRELDTRLLPLLTQSAKNGSAVDLQDAFERFAFDNVCYLVFDADLAILGGGKAAEDGEIFYQAFEEAAHLSIQRWSYPFHWMWKLMRWLNAGSERRLQASVAQVRLSIKKLMRRRCNTGTRSDLLSKFAESGEHSDDSLLDILVSFILAGRDTTPSALTWFFWALSSAPPNVTRLILEEIKSVKSKRSNSGMNGVFTLEELRGMQYLHAALTESMRLHTPVPMLPRECIEDDVLPDGTVVKKGWTVMYSAFAMGRSERVWGKDWEEFKPERWWRMGFSSRKVLSGIRCFILGRGCV